MSKGAQLKLLRRLRVKPVVIFFVICAKKLRWRVQMYIFSKRHGASYVPVYFFFALQRYFKQYYLRKMGVELSIPQNYFILKFEIFVHPYMFQKS